MRFSEPDPGQAFQSEYDISSQEIADLVGRNPQAFTLRTLDLSSAGSLFLNEPGFGFRIIGYNASTGAKAPETLCNVYINAQSATGDSEKFPGKAGRGFRGAFSKLFITWPVDPDSANNRIAFVIFKSRLMPWIGGFENL